MDNIVTITVPVVNPSKIEEEAYQSYKNRMAGDHPLISDPMQIREYHLSVASWEISARDPVSNGWRRAAREWVEANPL